MQDPHKLLPIAYRAAASIVRSPVLAEEAGERAVHLLTLAMLQGNPPHHPEAWLRVVARRSACALLRSSWARTQSTADDAILDLHVRTRQPRSAGADFVRERVDGWLTPRQRDALTAALSCNSTRAAARSCGMQPRDFRRYLRCISDRARATLTAEDEVDALADDACAQFGLAP